MQRKYFGFLPFFLLSFIVMLVFTWLIYLQLGRPLPGFDDAYIYFVYGRNITEGYGVVYNPGGERVEGFTSPLWLLIVTIVSLFTSEPELWMLAFSLLTVSFALAYLWYYLSEGSLFNWSTLFFLVWIFSAPAFVIWMGLPLMDISLWAAILITASVVFLRATSVRLVSVMLALVVLARPEGLVWGIVFLCLYFLRIVARDGRKNAQGKIRWPAAVYIMSAVGLTLARLAYFGYPFPNTYYAKVGSDIWSNVSHGTLYLLRYVAASPAVMILVLGAAIAGIAFNLPGLLRRLSNNEPAKIDDNRVKFFLASVIVIVGLIVPVLSGGDHFSDFRFYQPIWPLMMLPLLFMARTIDQPLHHLLPFVALAGVIILLVFTPKYTWLNAANTRAEIEFAVAEYGGRFAQTFNTIFAGDPPSVGYGSAGKFAYVYDGYLLDIFGLNNVAMAHSIGDKQAIRNHASFDIDILLDQAPEIFYPKSCSEDLKEGTSRTIRFQDDPALDGIFEEPRFLERYVLAVLRDSGECAVGWFERGYFERLSSEGISIFELDYVLVHS